MKYLRKSLTVFLTLTFIATSVVYANSRPVFNGPFINPFMEVVSEPTNEEFAACFYWQDGRHRRYIMRIRDGFIMQTLGVTQEEWDEHTARWRTEVTREFFNDYDNSSMTIGKMLEYLFEQSQHIRLPNRRLTQRERQQWIDHYWYLGGPNEHELQNLSNINAFRSWFNLPPLLWCDDLGMAARFYSHTLSQHFINGGHHAGPYGGSRYVLRAFNVRAWGSNNMGMSLERFERSFARYQESGVITSAHERSLLSTNITHIGIGSFQGTFLRSHGYNFIR